MLEWSQLAVVHAFPLKSVQTVLCAELRIAVAADCGILP